jgi:signal transduction histidine kinase
VEATPDGGQITITAAQQDGTISLAIEDQGPGMTQDQHQRALHPFFTTKPGAVGLGLTVADKIIRQHKGTMTIETTPKKGTVVRITIPTGS